jgi:hypothetical protein
MSHRDYVRQQIIGIGVALEAGQPLQREHVRFLVDASKRAAAGRMTLSAGHCQTADPTMSAINSTLPYSSIAPS